MNIKISILLSTIVLLLAACSAAPMMQASYDPARLRFEGSRAFDFEGQFVSQFPDRSSGQPNNRLAAEWLKEQFTNSGWSCQIDQWEVVNYSEPVVLRNVVCKLPGASPREILVVTHHDQAPTTVEGADNDGSGIAILLHLGEIFGSEGSQPYTLVFMSADCEECGMLGTRRYIQMHANTRDIIAGISLDNLGRFYYSGMDMEATGQFRKVGALWLQLLAGETARAAGDEWVPKVRSPLDQALAQMVPVSFMDQGPMVAVGVPALGFVGAKPPEFIKLHKELYHSNNDLMKHQSAQTLHKAGRNAEELIRQLLSMQSFPQEAGPYIYFESSQQVLKGASLWSLFVGFVALFFAGSLVNFRTAPKDKTAGWRGVLLHFLGLWLPMEAAVLLLYGMVAVGVMDKYEVYPAVPKAPEIMNPNWPAVIIFLLGLVVCFYVGRRLVRRFASQAPSAGPAAVKSFALFIIGLAGVYVLVVNPFSLLFFIPLLFWFLIKGREGLGRVLDVFLFLLGGLMFYALFYFFGFVIEDMNFAFLWYLMMMFSIGEVGPLTALAIKAIVAAGLSIIVAPPVNAQR